MRLIDADALMDDINELKKSPWYNNAFRIDFLSDINGSRVVRSEAIDIVQRLCIDDAPTIDAVEVNKSGKWIVKDDEIFAPEYYCNQCGNRAEVDLYGEWILSDFCPHCGADMREREDE